jgi:hypothetical protein
VRGAISDDRPYRVHVDYFREMRRNPAANGERRLVIFDFP